MNLLLCTLLVVASAESHPLLILAPKEDLPALAAYVEHRRATWSPRLVSVEEVITTSLGLDAAESVKLFLYEAWKNGTTHVLLVGDSTRFPVRYMALDRKHAPARDLAFYPSDLYYADVAKPDGSFDDWNAYQDGPSQRLYGEVWGEAHKHGPINRDGVSYRPELCVGRWPSRSTEDTRALVEKTLHFEAASAVDERPRAHFVHVDGWVDARSHQAAMAQRLSARYSTRCLHQPEKAANVLTPLLSEDDAARTILFHSGHGNEKGWDHSLSTKSLTSRNFEKPHRLGFSVGCSTAVIAVQPPYDPYVDSAGQRHPGTNEGQVFSDLPPPPRCLQPTDLARTSFGAEAVLGPGGFMAYVGCTTGAQPCGLSLATGFAEHLAQGPCTVGEAWRAALVSYVDRERLFELQPTESWYPPSIFFQGMKFVLLGDPTLRLP